LKLIKNRNGIFYLKILKNKEDLMKKRKKISLLKIKEQRYIVVIKLIKEHADM